MDEKNKNLKHKVYEIIEGGLQGSRGARIFSWVVFILILLSNSFFVLTKIEEPGHKTEKVFEIVEILTIALLTAEVVLGFWTADIRFPEDGRPRLRYLREPMTIIGILAILPFYLNLILKGGSHKPAMNVIGFLTLLHLVKAGAIIWSNRKKPSAD